MSTAPTPLEILLVEDDKENLALLRETLPKALSGYELVWDPCDGFEEALRRLHLRRYDLVVTDVYQDRPGNKKGVQDTDDRAKDIVAEIRSKRFCPVILFSSGSRPESLAEEPFVRFADKSGGNTHIVSQLEEVLKTGIPGIARRLHDDIDRVTGSYLWGFLEQEWTRLVDAGMTAEPTLERVVRRRAAIQIGRLEAASEAPAEITSIEGAEFYICPPISSGDLRLGEILKRKGTDAYRVVLNPHCHLTTQPGTAYPRAEFVVTVGTLTAKTLLQKHPLQATKEAKRLNQLRKCLQSPALLGQPEGRYWFLPGFLDMPDLYSDFLQLESAAMTSIEDQFDRFAVLDAPFAEALQACFTAFYSAVGLSSLDPERFKRLL